MKNQISVLNVPRPATENMHAFVSWVIGFMAPAIPGTKAKLDVRSVKEIFNSFQEELTRFTDIERIRFRHELKDGESYSEEDHGKWLGMQSIELHVTEIKPGIYRLEANLYGPDILPSLSGDITKGFGYEPFMVFFVIMDFKDSLYEIRMLKNTQVTELHLREGAKPVDCTPAFSFVYKQEGAIQKGWEDFKSEFAENLEGAFKQITGGMVSDSEYSLSYENTFKVLKDSYDSAFQWAGSAFTPTHFSAYGNVLPTDEGFILHMCASFTFGRTYTFPLKPLRLVLQEDGFYTVES